EAENVRLQRQDLSSDVARRRRVRKLQNRDIVAANLALRDERGFQVQQRQRRKVGIGVLGGQTDLHGGNEESRIKNQQLVVTFVRRAVPGGATHEFSILNFR